MDRPPLGVATTMPYHNGCPLRFHRPYPRKGRGYDNMKAVRAAFTRPPREGVATTRSRTALRAVLWLFPDLVQVQ
jgi:hypothetical protein